jgi:cell cycle related kinase
VKRVRPSFGGESLQAVANTKSFVRELIVLNKLRGASPHIITIYDTFKCGSEMLLEMELMDCSLDDLISRSDSKLELQLVTAVSLGVLKGIQFCHNHGIMHRDIKPGNILVSTRGEVKLCDFGLARNFHSAAPTTFTPEVCTRWYKPVEVLLGSTIHTPSIDIWSFGCVIGELLNLSPLFPGSSDIEQLYLVESVLGKIDASAWPEADTLSDFGKIDFDLPPPVGLSEKVPSASPGAIELISGCLVFCPSHRWTADQCLASEWVRDSALSKPEIGQAVARVLNESTMNTVPFPI